MLYLLRMYKRKDLNKKPLCVIRTPSEQRESVCTLHYEGTLNMW